MLAKLINGVIQYAPKKIYIDNKLVFNPTDEQLKELGYKEIVYTEAPQTQVKGKFWASKFEDRVINIEQVWYLVDEPLPSVEQLTIELVSKQINTMGLTDNESLYFKSLYPLWEDLCNQKYVAQKADFKFVYGDKLYKTVQDNFTFQSQWVPGEGTSSIYTQIVETQAGTLDDPITVPSDVTTNSFTYVVGKYYEWNGKVYKCERQGETEGTEHSFVYSPDQLVGNYFTLVL